MFKPFEDESCASAIHDLTLENQLDCVNLYGNLQISKDKKGLETAKALQAFMNSVVEALEKDANLPNEIVLQQPKEVENPFL